jgi:hypothetical protein
MKDGAAYIRQTKVAAAVAVGELLVIQAQLVTRYRYIYTRT